MCVLPYNNYMFKHKLIAKSYDHRSRPEREEPEDPLFPDQPHLLSEDNLLLEVLSPTYFPQQELHYSIQDFIHSLQTEEHSDSPPLEDYTEYPSPSPPALTISQVNARYLLTMGEAWQPSAGVASRVKWSGEVRVRYFCGEGAAVEVNDEEQYTSFDMQSELAAD